MNEEEKEIIFEIIDEIKLEKKDSKFISDIC